MLAVAFVPAEGGDAVVVAVQDAGLAARRHRRQDRLPARQLVAAVADPVGHRVDRAGAHPAGQDRMGQPVDLDDDQARLVGMALRALDEQPLDEEAVVRAATVDAEDRRQDRVDDRVDERRDQGRPEAVDVDARRPLGDHDERDDLEDEHEDADEDERDPRGEGEDDRSDGGVEQRDEDDGECRVDRPVDGQPGHDPGGREERDGRDDEGDDEPLEQRDRAAAPLPEDADLRRVEVPQAHRRSPPSVRRIGHRSSVVVGDSIGREPCPIAGSRQRRSVRARMVVRCRSIAALSPHGSTDRCRANTGKPAGRQDRRI